MKLQVDKVLIATSVVGLCVSKVVKTIIQNNTPEQDKLLAKAAVYVGTFVLASMVADAASTYTASEIEKYKTMYNALRNAQNAT